ncbi:MAG TPA: hypothetical protein VIT67_21560, partial [Povalibacter sp.]
TILYTAGAAIKIRGNPFDKAVVDGNVFSHGDSGSAIKQTGTCGLTGGDIFNPIDVRPNNIFGVDPMKELAQCDFVGDGKLDDFMATGATWWAQSHETGEWRYLNTMKESLPQLMVGKMDHDDICDVALKPSQPGMAPQMYSKSGTGPWIPLVIGAHQ